MHEPWKWFLSPERLFLDCWTRAFLRDHVAPSALAEAGDTAPPVRACNVGIGAGEWDDWLGFWLHGHGELVSVDINEHQVKGLAQRQAREGHPNPSTVMHADLLRAELGPFDLVTVVGSTLHETHAPARALRCATQWVRPGGLLYATVMHGMGDPEQLFREIGGQTVARRSFEGLPDAHFTAVVSRIAPGPL